VGAANLNLEDAIDEIDRSWDGVSARDQWHHSAAGDCLFFIHEQVPYYAQRVDGLLTVYRALSGDRIVGLQIKGIGARKIDMVHAQVKTRDGGPDLVRLLISAYKSVQVDETSASEEERLSAYAEAAKVAIAAAA